MASELSTEELLSAGLMAALDELGAGPDLARSSR